MISEKENIEKIMIWLAIATAVALTRYIFKDLIPIVAGMLVLTAPFIAPFMLLDKEWRTLRGYIAVGFTFFCAAILVLAMTLLEFSQK